MPNSHRRIFGDVQTTKYCPFCEREYQGDERNVDKLVRLHMKKAHNARPSFEVSCSFLSHNGDMKKANADCNAALQQVQEIKKRMDGM